MTDQDRPRRKRFVHVLHRVAEYRINGVLGRMQDDPGLTVDHVYARHDPEYLALNVVIHYRATEVWKG